MIKPKKDIKTAATGGLFVVKRLEIYILPIFKIKYKSSKKCRYLEYLSYFCIEKTFM